MLIKSLRSICFHVLFVIPLLIMPFLVRAVDDVKDQNLPKQPPIELSKELTEILFKQVGSARFEFLFWDIYNSVLYTPSGIYEGNTKQNFIFKIEYLKDITSKELIKRTIEQWQHLNYKQSDYENFIPLLKSIWPDIKAGDSLTLYNHDDISVFYFNDLKVGTINDIRFSHLFLDIWLSPDSSEPKLRADLIGKNKK